MTLRLLDRLRFAIVGEHGFDIALAIEAPAASLVDALYVA
jgi:hypothetical protein